MINLIIDWKPVQIEFMGETVTADVRPLTRDQMLAIVPYLTGADMSKLDATESSKSVLKLQEAAAPILPDVVRNLKGIQVNGTDLTDLSMLGSEAVFCALAVQLISQAVMATNIDKESEKNLQPPPAGKSPGQIADQ